MKALHKIPFKSLNGISKEYHGLIRIHNGYAYATDGSMAAKIPVADLLGEDVIQEREEFYIDRKEWGSQKLHAAEMFTIEGNKLRGLKSNGAFVGETTLVVKKSYETTLLGFPNVESAMPDLEDYEYQISLNPDLLKNLFDSLRIQRAANPRVILRLRGNKPMSVIYSDEKGVMGSASVLMPARNIKNSEETYPNGTFQEIERRANLTDDEQEKERDEKESESRIEVVEDKVVDLEEKIEAKDEQIEDLKGEIEDLKGELEDMKDGYGKVSPEKYNTNVGFIYIATENLLATQIVEAFAECLAEVNPHTMLDNLEIIKKHKTIY